MDISRFFLESSENARMAGLLTYSDNERLPEIFARFSGFIVHRP